MSNQEKPNDHSHQDKDHHLLQEWGHDSYKSKHKLPEPTVCPGCGAVYHLGHWVWAPAPEGAHAENCPACLRIADRVPAGQITLSGNFLADHLEEVIHLMRHVEERERGAHPLKRIMAIEQQSEQLVITVTDPHLARGIGEAIHHAYQGELAYNYQKEEWFLRVTWHRND